MNPALPVLILLALAGTAVARWRGAGDLARAWLMVTLAATALLAPALVLPDGIPSPSGNLGGHVPWQAAVDPAGSNPNLRDVTFFVEPWLVYLRDEWRAGRPGLWNPHQSLGAPLWANGQSAPLFPLTWLFAAVPLWLGWVLLPWLRFVAAGLGAWVLARELGVREEGAAVAALVYPLSGMVVPMLLFPMGSALALVPWALWATERLATGRSRGALLAGVAGLQLLAGHPETCIHTALLCALYLAIRGPSESLKAPSPTGRGGLGVRGSLWLHFTGAWFLAAGVAAAALWPLAAFVVESTKYLEHTAVTRPPVLVVVREMMRLVLPEAYGSHVEGTWFGPFNYAATASYAGALALPLAAAGLGRVRRSRPWTAVCVVGVVSFLVAYHLPGLWDLVIRLPVLERVAQHRLIFGMELSLALLAAAGLDRLLQGRGRGLLIGSGLVVLLLGLTWLLFAEDWRREGLVASQLLWTLGVASLAGLAAAAVTLLPSRRRGLLAVLVPALLAVDLLHAHGSLLGALPREDHYPRTGAVEFLQGRPGRVAGVGRALAPNAATVYGLYDLRGDDPLKLARFERLYARLAPSHPVYFQPVNRWDEDLLDLLGVRWVMGAPGEEPPQPGWRLAYDGSDARVWERPGASPWVRADGVGFQVEAREAGHWDLIVVAHEPGRVEIAETWDAGWRARLDGEPVPVETWEPVPGSALLAVEVPPGRHRLRLTYRPPGLPAGGVLSAISLLLLGLWACHNPQRIEP